MSDDEAARETRRRMRSVLAKDLLQLERSMNHWLTGLAMRELRDLADALWDQTAVDPFGDTPDVEKWWHCPEVWEQ